MANVRGTAGNRCVREIRFYVQPKLLSQHRADYALSVVSDQAVIQMTTNDRDHDWQEGAGSVISLLTPPIAVLAHQRGASNGSQNQHDLR